MEPAPLSGGVRRITLDAAGTALSALLAEPAGEPRALVVALHGGGMNAGYFDGQADPSVSLLTLGAGLGHTVLALDRPGYGRSAEDLPDGRYLADQVEAVRAALADFTSRYPAGAGVVLLGHSFGGKVALAAAAEEVHERLLGVDVNGCGHRYADGPPSLPEAGPAGSDRMRHWGPLRLYPPRTFSTVAPVVCPLPPRERAEAVRWPDAFPEVAARVRVPVRLTFAEYEGWWRHDEEAIGEMIELLAAAPRVQVDRQSAAGHNISLGWTARAHHLRVLAFAEECALGVATAPARSAAGRPHTGTGPFGSMSTLPGR
ncbi:alpha/beta fold hydrolase [Streptomyces sp. TRM49041]|uniref:alpha/beta hydrolase n=1 Tax=Streptomyces sp. TRM49041 TaxID=2603216 RepID=UPI0011F07217|nr:alpha/beta hydrolase [Streptomyces sp. TRM49041]